MSAAADDQPWISVIIVTYNDGAWLPRCLDSLHNQTISRRLEIIVADNASTNDTAQVAQQLLVNRPRCRFVQNGANLGFGPGNNRATHSACGKYLYFINADTWFEPDCLEQLYQTAERSGAGGLGTTILEYTDDTLIAQGSDGMDCFANPVSPRRGQLPNPLFCIAGFYLIRRDVFERIGGFDDEYFMYGEELDVSWRLWASGEQVVLAHAAQVHHRGAVGVNPDGGLKPTEHRTSKRIRFYANRNQMITIAKNSQWLLLLFLLPLAVLIWVEGLLTLAMTRSWDAFRQTSLSPFAEFIRLMPHICRQRRSFRAIRKHGDFWMLRFLRPRFGRWEEVKKIFRLGFPKFK